MLIAGYNAHFNSPFNVGIPINNYVAYILNEGMILLGIKVGVALIFTVSVYVIEKLCIKKRMKSGVYIKLLVLSVYCIVLIFFWGNMWLPGITGIIVSVVMLFLLGILLIYFQRVKLRSRYALERTFIIFIPILLVFVFYGMGVDVARNSDLYVQAYICDTKGKTNCEEDPDAKAKGLCYDKICKVVYVEKEKAMIQLRTDESIIPVKIDEKSRLVSLTHAELLDN
ncbi:hypothetical protein ACIQLG_16610 [Terribacillus saccharophilus]|uniref:hypothetical protein n=1 Tax=Terribacillus saccharophilus TaxID=361277 RepID=UPI0037FD7C53